MSRIRHPFSGYRRLMQMSETVLYIFVEGTEYDRYFYSQIAECECQKRGTRYKVIAAKELPGGAGGKPALLSFFDYLRRRNSLVDTFKGVTTVSIFFVDKDVDDFLRTKRHCENIVYTETYELENYLFIYGDISMAAAAAATLDIGSVRDGIRDHTSWRQHAAENWKEWVKLCLFSHCRKIGSIYGYGRPNSPINAGAYGLVQKSVFEYHLTTLQNSSGTSEGRFKRSFAHLSRKVDTYYSLGQHDLIFKGKWYVCFMAEDIKRIASGRSYRPRYFDKTLLTSLAQNLDFNGAWADHFKRPISALLTRAGI